MNKCHDCPRLAQIAGRCMGCWVHRMAKSRDLTETIWWGVKKPLFIANLMGRFEALAEGLDVPSADLIIHEFLHGKIRVKRAQNPKIAAVREIIQQADRLAEKERHERTRSDRGPAA